MLTVGSLFSGIGGFDLGLERAGMRVIWQSEIDTYASAVLRKHWPAVPNLGDIRGISAQTLADAECAERWTQAEGRNVHNGNDTGREEAPSRPAQCCPDVLCGGFPCQDISNAGKRAGIDGERSGLWSEFARLIGELRPRYAIMENVAALLGRGLERVLGDLAALGYDAEWHCIPASAVGAPHRRDRIWIVGDASGEGPQGYGSEHKLRSLGRQLSVSRSGWWSVEPDVGRVAHGVPSWLDGLDLDHSVRYIMDYANQALCSPAEALRMVRATYGKAEVFQWETRSAHHVCAPQILLPFLRRLETEFNQEHDAQARQEATPRPLRGLPHDEAVAGAPLRPESDEQRGKQHSDALQELSRLLALDCQAAWEKGRWTYAADRVGRLRCLGNAIVPQCAEIIGRAIIAAEGVTP
jgi:DNA (cytosine-5)-methyltransferase 1